MSETTKLEMGFQSDGSFLFKGLATPKSAIKEGEDLKVANIIVTVSLPKFMGFKGGKVVERSQYTTKVVQSMVVTVAEVYKALNSTTFGTLLQGLEEELRRNPWLVVLFEGLAGEIAVIRKGDKVKTCSAVAFSEAFRFVRKCSGEVEEKETAEGLPDDEQGFE